MIFFISRFVSERKHQFEFLSEDHAFRFNGFTLPLLAVLRQDHLTRPLAHCLHEPLQERFVLPLFLEIQRVLEDSRMKELVDKAFPYEELQVH